MLNSNNKWKFFLERYIVEIDKKKGPKYLFKLQRISKFSFIPITDQ